MTKARRGSRRCSSGRSSSSPRRAGRGDGRRDAGQSRRRRAAGVDGVRCQGRAGAELRLSEDRRAHLHRGRGRHRRAGGARQPLDLSDRRAGRFQGPGIAKDDELPVGLALLRQRTAPAAGGAAPSPVRRSNCASCRGSTGIGSPSRRRRTSSTTTGRSRRKPTGWATASAAGAARLRRAGAAVRCRLRSVEHRRQLLSLWLDPGSGRNRTDHPASRCGLGGGYFMVGRSSRRTWI